MTDTEGQDTTILFGIPSIAEHLGITERQARHLSDKGSLPTFKLPKSAIICARRETLKTWLAEQEAAARQPRPAPPPEPAAPPAPAAVRPVVRRRGR